MKEKEFYTSGEIAKMAGVTIRTVRYYDTKGILKPSHRSNSGHRLYSKDDFTKLKKILALKYLGLSLEEVMNIELKNFKKEDMIKSLKLQKNILKNKVNHIKTVVNAIEAAENSMNDNMDLDWDKTVDIIQILEEEKELLQQYLDSSNLNASVKLQDRFSSNEHGWYEWTFNKLGLDSNCRILEIGCGNGELWSKNTDKIHNSLDITLIDACEDMIKEAKKNISKNKGKFSFQIANPNKIEFKNESFDVVIANHVLFYMKDLDEVLSEINRVLKPGGRFYCSTMDSNSMKEFKDFIIGFNNSIKIIDEKLTQKFGRDNGQEILSKYFTHIKTHLYEDKLVVNDRDGMLEYIYSIPGNILEVVDTKKKEFESYVDKNILNNGAILITNKSVLFESRKI